MIGNDKCKKQSQKLLCLTLGTVYRKYSYILMINNLIFTLKRGRLSIVSCYCETVTFQLLEVFPVLHRAKHEASI